MDIIHNDCTICSTKSRKSCCICKFFLLNRIKEQFENKETVDITTTNTTYHFDKQNAKMKVSRNLLIVDVIENNIETPIFFHKDQIIEVN